MTSYWMEWAGMLLRWAHLVVGIAWIGSSFYFMWLDAQLNRPPQNPESDRVGGDLWSVHGGGFYHAQKYTVAPSKIPEPLHWFKWEAYTTWLTGFALLIVTYYWNAELYLVDRNVADLSATTAILISLGLLVAGWILYDLLCRSGLPDLWVATIGFVILCAGVYGVSHLFGGRGLFMQIGAMLGTIMAANVLMVIIPGQRAMVAAVEAGHEPDPGPGLKGKQRSKHNNYLTLPVLFVMLSNHYPMTFGHGFQWLVLLWLFVIGALIRHYFNLRNSGNHQPLIPALAVAGLVVLAIMISPAAIESDNPVQNKRMVVNTTSAEISTDHVMSIIYERCQTCHSATPTHPTAPVPPKGVRLDSLEDLQLWATQVYEMTVVNRSMPLANLTEITELERAAIAQWFAAKNAKSATPEQ